MRPQKNGVHKLTVTFYRESSCSILVPYSFSHSLYQELISLPFKSSIDMPVQFDKKSTVFSGAILLKL